MRSFGRYHPIVQLGRGGMATVYLAVASGPGGFHKLVVVKKLEEHLTHDPEFLAMFLDEARLAARLSHPNVVQTNEVCADEEPYFIVMEYVEGQPLHRLVNRARGEGGLPAALSIRILIEVLAGLEHAHELVDFDGTPLGVVHRDVSPHNVIVSSTGQVKILDFGIAKALGASTVTQAGVVKGKLAYMAPEQARGEPVDRRADVYSVGVMLWEALTGRRLFKELGDAPLLKRIQRGDVPSPRTEDPAVSPALEAICLKALAFDRERRHASAAELGHELESALAAQGERPQLREVGQVVTRLFAKERTDLRALIEERIARAPSSSESVRDGLLSLPVVDVSASEKGATPVNAAKLSDAPVAVRAPAQTVVSASGPTRRAGAAWRVLATSAGLALVAVVAARSSSGGAQALVAAAGVSGPGATASASPVAAPEPAGSCPGSMVLVSGGRFTMGSDDPSFKLWSPAHRVAVDTFCIDRDEVTTASYRSCVDAGRCDRPPRRPSYPRAAGVSPEEHERTLGAQTQLCNFDAPERSSHPINCVSWHLADAYCRSRGGRLPTEAEWEYVARGSGEHRYPWGDEPGDAEHMNACGLECTAWERDHGLRPSARMYETDDGFLGTAPVGSFPKGRTSLGVNDLVGNVWEWTADWFEIYKGDEQLNPKGARTGDKKAIRGGGFNGGVQLWLTPAFRYHQLADASAPAIGFRCAASL